MPKNNLRKKLTRQEQRDLDIEISFLEGLLGRDPEYVEALQILGDDYTRRGLLEEGLRVDQRLSELRPNDPLVYYNLACSYSLSKQIDLAFCSLERALQLGYRDFKWMARDPDLRNLRVSPHYKKIRAKLRLLRYRKVSR
jgi:tetratricopeptide (TPR) repeat protein